MNIRTLSKIKLVLVLLLFFSLSSENFAQNNRTIDGTGNNVQNVDYGSAGGDVIRITSVGFTDGVSSPAGVNRPNARLISNQLFAQNASVHDEMELSDFVWVFGQFIDHDITASPDNHNESLDIQVPANDQWFDPYNTGQIVIPMARSQAKAGTGTDASNPRNYTNDITAWIDGSAVYGSDLAKAAWLRTFVGGKLKSSAGNLPPYNTTSGELSGTVDNNAPSMANENPNISKWFVCGDFRANENVLLASYHTMFLREHNRLCDSLSTAYPNWSDEQLYQRSRKFVGAFIQAIVYEEWLPTMGVNIPPYIGYSPSINPNISNVFATAAYRLGHTLLSSDIIRMDNDGNVIPEGNITLANAFFNPSELADFGIDVYLKGMATQVEQQLDHKVIDDIRNFLFGVPGAGGLDLAAININRGRERGLAHFNQIRIDLGLQPYSFFSQINPDPSVFTNLQQTYLDINNIDPWVGMLAESNMNGTIFGQTIMEIVKKQFKNLRDGDRFYYENDPTLTMLEKEAIKKTTLGAIVLRNTDITLMQENVFAAMPHDSIPICDAQVSSSNLNGFIKTMSGDLVSNVNVGITGAGNTIPDIMTTGSGAYEFTNITPCEYFTIVPQKNIEPLNGVTTIDIVFVQRHILGIGLLDSPYKIIAADINKSSSVTTLDLVEMQRMVLHLIPDFTNNTSWRFVDADYVFATPATPLNENFPEFKNVETIQSNIATDFVAIKVGDVNNSANPANLTDGALTRSGADPFVFEVMDQEVIGGNEFKVTFKANPLDDVLAYQYTLNYDESLVRYKDIQVLELNDLSKENFGVFEEKGAITTAWYGQAKTDEETALFEITFVALENANLSDVLNLDGSLTPSVAYQSDLQAREVILNIVNNKDNFFVQQNSPNPFTDKTNIAVNMPESGYAKLTVYDLSGRVLKVVEKEFVKGSNEFDLYRDEFTAGTLYYEVSTDFGSQTHKMIVH